MEFSLLYWILALSPVLVLLVCLLFFRWEAAKSGAIAWFTAVFAGFIFYGADMRLLALASSKGLSLTVYVISIIWAAVFLYNIADTAGAIGIIGNTMTKLSDDRLLQCLLLAWCFTSVLQGLAGFGVPIAVVAPIMVVMGFKPITAVSSCLIGHSWSISFGSMGSSYNAIQLVTGIPGDVIGPQMALLFCVSIFGTGFCVAHIYGGFAAVKRSLGPVFSAGGVMSAALWFMNYIGAAQLASLIAAVSGCAVILLWARLWSKKNATASRDDTDNSRTNFSTACTPYLVLIGLSIFLQIKPVKSALAHFFWGLSYPAVETAKGYAVEAVTGYSKIQFFSHPAPILIVSAFIGYFVYKKALHPSKDILRKAAQKTVARCVPTSLGIATMVMMALIMSDSGMTNMIAQGAARGLGSFYSLASPFIGMLGTFITGSNTNSNIMFGLLQYETALVLGKSAVLLAAAQSVGGSLGVAISPSTIMMGATNVGLSGSESDILKKNAPYCILNLFLVGLVVLLFA